MYEKHQILPSERRETRQCFIFSPKKMNQLFRLLWYIDSSNQNDLHHLTNHWSSFWFKLIRLWSVFFFLKDTFIRPISVSFKRRNAPSLSSSCFERFSSNCRMKKCLEQIRCRISVWSWAAPQPRLSQRAWPAAAAEADMHRIYSTDNFSSPYKLPNSVRYLS